MHAAAASLLRLVFDLAAPWGQREDGFAARHLAHQIRLTQEGHLAT